MESWIGQLRDRCGPLTDAAAMFAAQMGVERDPPRGVDGLVALSRAVSSHLEEDSDDERVFIELAGSYLAVVLCDALGRGKHVSRRGQHRVDLGHASFDPFEALERVLAADDATRALAREISRVEAEASGEGPCARVVSEIEAQLREHDPHAVVVEQIDTTLKAFFHGELLELDITRLLRATEDLDQARRARAVTRFLSALPSLASPESAWSLARESLMPRPIALHTLSGLPAGSELYSAPLFAHPRPDDERPDDPRLGFVLRSEGRARYVHVRETRAWDVSAAQLHAAAIDNLAMHSKQAKLVCTDTQHGPMVVARSGDGLDAARVLLPGLIDVLGPELGVPFAVAIPHRDTLLACPLDAPAAVAQLTMNAREQAQRAAHAISAEVLQLGRDGLCARKEPGALKALSRRPLLQAKAPA